MNKSNEIRELVLNSYKAMRDGDVRWWETHQSRQEGVLTIGTDPDEWWAGYANILQAVRPQIEGMTGSIIEGDPQAYAEGTVGWFADSIRWKLPNGAVVSARLTGVCVREQGEWKFVQTHFSIGVPNEEAFG